MSRDAPVADHEAALRTAFELFAEAGARLDTVGLVAVGHRVVHGGPDLYRPTPVDDALIEKLDELSPAGAAAQSARSARHRRGPQGAAGPAAHRGVRHRVLSRPATRGCHVCHRPRCRRAVAHPALRVSRHVTPVRQRTGGALPGRAAGIVEPDRAAPGQRRVGVRDRRWTPGRHLDGVDADGGTGDGHALRRHRPRRDHVPVADGQDERRGYRVDAQPPLRRAGSRRRDRLPGPAQTHRIRRHRSTIGLRRVHPPAAQVHRRVPGAARQRRRHHVHRRGRGERRRGAPRRAVRYGGARHRTRRAPQRQPRQGRPAASRPTSRRRPCSSSRPTRSWPSPAPASR